MQCPRLNLLFLVYTKAYGGLASYLELLKKSGLKRNLGPMMGPGCAEAVNRTVTRDAVPFLRLVSKASGQDEAMEVFLTASS